MSKNSKAAIITEEYFQKTVNYIEGQKAQNTLAFADQIAGINWRQSKKCPICKQDLIGTTLTSALSEKEFGISGMCQKCQDKIFGEKKKKKVMMMMMTVMINLFGIYYKASIK